MRAKKPDPSTLKLTSIELSVLNALWDTGRPMTSEEIRKITSPGGGTDHYLFKVLKNLMRKGAIKESGKVEGITAPFRLFSYIVSREDYHSHVFSTLYDSSVSNFLNAITKTPSSSKEIVSELREWLTEYDSSDPPE